MDAVQSAATHLEYSVTDSWRLGFDNTYARDLEGCYVPHTLAGFPNAEVLAFNEPLAESLGLDAKALGERAAELVSGTLVPDDALPLAQAYAGHQFGGFSPQLGDGRAALLGELLDTKGNRYDLQLKGSGRTAFSRGGDGLASVGPVLREYVMGEAMHHLGIPTTRALGAVKTGEMVIRSEYLPGAVLARVAASHLRVGTLEFFASRRDTTKLAEIVKYTLARHYPEKADSARPADALLRSVAAAQAETIAQWMLVGFIHGVMNTDNATLSGETIDYGPCAFMDAYDPATVFSSIDRRGRYAYGNQPGIGQWNVARMGEALLPLLAQESGTGQEEAVESVRAATQLFGEVYSARWLDGMRRKLGLQGEHEGDEALVEVLFKWMAETASDFTQTFRGLADERLPEEAASSVDAEAWLKTWQKRLGEQDMALVKATMNRVNPLYIPRNYQVEAALDAAIAEDLEPFETLMEVLSQPFDAQQGREAYEAPAPKDFGPYQTFCGT